MVSLIETGSIQGKICSYPVLRFSPALLIEPDRPRHRRANRRPEELARAAEEEVLVATRIHRPAGFSRRSSSPQPVMDLALAEELLPPAAVLPDNAGWIQR